MGPRLLIESPGGSRITVLPKWEYKDGLYTLSFVFEDFPAKISILEEKNIEGITKLLILEKIEEKLQNYKIEVR